MVAGARRVVAAAAGTKLKALSSFSSSSRWLIE